MTYQYSSQVVKGMNSDLASGEKNDCFVKAVASATGSSYNDAHAFVKEKFNRQDGKGTMVELNLKNVTKSTQVIGSSIKADFIKLGTDKIKNTYRLYGEEVKRQKTVKSFIKSNPKGTFIVLVAGHAFTIKDGVLIDNIGEEFRPTRKVQGAIEVKTIDTSAPVQLSLF